MKSKYCFRQVKKVAILFKRRIISLKFNLLIKSVSGKIECESHVLVSKRPIYAQVAKICIESFCFYNKDKNVVVHTDLHTHSAMQTHVSGLIKKGRVRVVCDQNDNSTWQEQKIFLICQLVGTKDLFMDADLKWNSKLPSIYGITFFVNEFSLDEHYDFRQFLMCLKTMNRPLGSMKNTSFFTWHGKTPANSEVETLEMVYRSLLIESRLNPELATKLDLVRISEQLALSIWVEQFFQDEVYFLKVSDGLKDGSFVESSYFGATGSRF